MSAPIISESVHRSTEICKHGNILYNKENNTIGLDIVSDRPIRGLLVNIEVEDIFGRVIKARDVVYEQFNRISGNHYHTEMNQDIFANRIKAIKAIRIDFANIVIEEANVGSDVQEVKSDTKSEDEIFNETGLSSDDLKQLETDLLNCRNGRQMKQYLTDKYASDNLPIYQELLDKLDGTFRMEPIVGSMKNTLDSKVKEIIEEKLNW